MTLLLPTYSQSTMAKSYGVGGVEYHVGLTDTAKTAAGVLPAAKRAPILAPPHGWQFAACSRAVLSSRNHTCAHGTERQAGRAT